MSDAVKERFSHLHGDRPPHPFASATAIATRGRRKRARKQVAVATATAGVLVAGATLTAALRDSQPPVHPGATPSTQVDPSPATPAPTTVADSALLRPADAGAGWVEMTDLEMFEGFPIWVWAQLGCAAMNPADYPAIAHQLDVKTAGLRMGSPTTAVIAEAVERYESTWGPQSMTDIRAVVATCATFTETNGDVSWRTTLTLTSERFAGDDSLMVTSTKEQIAAPAGEQAGPVREYILVVRVGDQLATIKSGYADPEFLTAIAQKAAAHLAS